MNSNLFRNIHGRKCIDGPSVPVRVTWVLLLLFAFLTNTYVQSINDYRTVDYGPFDDFTNWEYWDGDFWEPASTSPDENDGTATGASNPTCQWSVNDGEVGWQDVSHGGSGGFFPIGSGGVGGVAGLKMNEVIVICFETIFLKILGINNR